MILKDFSALIEWIKENMSGWKDSGSYFQSPNHRIRVGHSGSLNGGIYIATIGSGDYTTALYLESNLVSPSSKYCKLKDIIVDEEHKMFIFDDFLALKYE